jgi:hypothetical protein
MEENIQRGKLVEQGSEERDPKKSSVPKSSVRKKKRE